MKLSDPDSNVYVRRDGRILFDGEYIGFVQKVEVEEGPSIAGMAYRAELGDPGRPNEWPPYRVEFRAKRGDAIEAVLEGVEEPSETTEKVIALTLTEDQLLLLRGLVADAVNVESARVARMKARPERTHSREVMEHAVANATDLAALDVMLTAADVYAPVEKPDLDDYSGFAR